MPSRNSEVQRKLQKFNGWTLSQCKTSRSIPRWRPGFFEDIQIAFVLLVESGHYSLLDALALLCQISQSITPSNILISIVHDETNDATLHLLNLFEASMTVLGIYVNLEVCGFDGNSFEAESKCRNKALKALTVRKVDYVVWLNGLLCPQDLLGLLHKSMSYNLQLLCSAEITARQQSRLSAYDMQGNAIGWTQLDGRTALSFNLHHDQGLFVEGQLVQVLTCSSSVDIVNATLYHTGLRYGPMSGNNTCEDSPQLDFARRAWAHARTMRDNEPVRIGVAAANIVKDGRDVTELQEHSAQPKEQSAALSWQDAPAAFICRRGDEVAEMQMPQCGTSSWFRKNTC